MALNAQEHAMEELQKIIFLSKVITLSLIVIIFYCLFASTANAEPIAFNESLPGERNIGQNFTFTMSNVSGTYARCVYQYTVYDYREIGENFTYYSVNWGQWFKQDAEKGKKYVAVWIRGTMEGTSYFGWGPDFFKLWVWGNQTVLPEPVLMQDIEIANVKRSGKTYTKTGCGDSYTVSEDLSVADSWDGNESGRRLPAVIAETEDLKATTERGQLSRERYGWKDEHELDRMVPGEKWEGYILYQIPKAATANDIQVAGNFRAAGAAIWNLKERVINQDSAERYRHLESLAIDVQKKTGVRLPDRQPDRVMA